MRHDNGGGGACGTRNAIGSGNGSTAPPTIASRMSVSRADRREHLRAAHVAKRRETLSMIPAARPSLRGLPHHRQRADERLAHVVVERLADFQDQPICRRRSGKSPARRYALQYSAR
jgi:hypothetical protein